MQATANIDLISTILLNIINVYSCREANQRKNLTIDARKLQGETFRVSLRKGAKGFGFTIVGGEQPGEVLQVNNIVRGGAADTDKRLRTGDIIMRLNGRNVLSWSHSDIIKFLQSTRVSRVNELCFLLNSYRRREDTMKKLYGFKIYRNYTNNFVLCQEILVLVVRV